MATLAQKIECERNAREMLRREGLPEPDAIEYGYTCIRLIWAESKVALVVEIDKPPKDFEVVGDYLDDLGNLPLDADRHAGGCFDYDDADEERERLNSGEYDGEDEMD